MIPQCYKTSFSGLPVTKGRSNHHSYEFIRHSEFGLCLFLDGILQSAEDDQHIYHQKLVLAALEEQPSPSRALIIGGAGGGAVFQLRKLLGNLPCQITVVDIDKKLFCLGHKLMETWGSHALRDKRVNIVFADGADFIKRTNQKFDMIILDVGDPLPNTKSNRIYSRSVLADIGRVLQPNGVVSYHSAVENTLNHVFVTESLHENCVLGKASHFRTNIPSFERCWVFNTLKKHSL